MMRPSVAAALAGLLTTAGTALPAAAETNPRPKVGKPAPNLRLFTFDGARKVKLSDLAYPGRERPWAKKRPVLLDFFRTDCEPCLKAIPELVTLHDLYQPRGVEVVLVALLEETDGRQKLRAYLEMQKLPFIVLVDRNDFYATKYLGKTVSLPATFLIDRQGVLRGSKFDAKGSLLDHFRDALESVTAEHARAEAPQ